LQGEIDPMTETNIKLLGLQDTKASALDLNKDSFTSDFQEINKILHTLSKEVNIFLIF
jgi:hypothetical protein